MPNNQAPSYPKDLVAPYDPIRALRSHTAGLLVVFKSRMGARAFGFQASFSTFEPAFNNNNSLKATVVAI